MGNCFNNVQGINYGSCNDSCNNSCSNTCNSISHGLCNQTSKLIIIAAVIALILVNVLDEESTECIGQFMQTIGELMILGVTGGCFNQGKQQCSCHYY